MSLISEVIAALTKAQQVVGDAEVILHHADTEVETVLSGLVVAISTGGDAPASSAALIHTADARADDPPADTADPAPAAS